MVDEKAGAPLDSIEKGGLVLVSPLGFGSGVVGLAVVQHQDVIIGKVVLGEILGRGLGDVDGDRVAVFEDCLERGGGLFPDVASVVAGDDQAFDRIIGGQRGRACGEGEETKN